MVTGVGASASGIDKSWFNVLFMLWGNLVSLKSTGSIALPVGRRTQGKSSASTLGGAPVLLITGHCGTRWKETYFCSCFLSE